MTVCVKCGFDPAIVPAKTWELEIPYIVKSMNAHHVNAGAARHVYRRDRGIIQTALMVERRRLRVPRAIKLRQATLTRVMGYGQREFDRDNLHGGCKIVVDAMVIEELLVGDTREWARVFYDQVRSTNKKPALRILLEELP